MMKVVVTLKPGKDEPPVQTFPDAEIDWGNGMTRVWWYVGNTVKRKFKGWPTNDILKFEAEEGT